MPTPSRWVAPTPLSIRELVDLTAEIATEVAAGRHEVCFDPGPFDHRSVGGTQELVRMNVPVPALLTVTPADRSACSLDDDNLATSPLRPKAGLVTRRRRQHGGDSVEASIFHGHDEGAVPSVRSAVDGGCSPVGSTFHTK